jgi:hypothetical protein
VSVLALRNQNLLQRLAMSNPHNNPHKIAIIGFSSFERATFESFFRLAARRPPGYVLVADTREANLAVVNADDASVLRAAIDNKPCAHILLIGNADGGTGWAIQKRPLNLMKVLTTVELLLNGPQAVVATGARSAAQQMAFARTQSDVRVPTPVAAASVTSAPPRVATSAFASSAFTPQPGATAPPTLVRRVESTITAPSMRPRANDVRMGTGDFANSRTESPVLGATRPASIEEDQNVDHILVVDDTASPALAFAPIWSTRGRRLWAA